MRHIRDHVTECRKLIPAPILVENILRIASDEPHRIFANLIHPGKSDDRITYSRLIEGASRYAACYQRAGVQAQDVVIVVLRHGVDLLYAFTGAMVHGSVPSMFAFPSTKVPNHVYEKTVQSLLEITRPRAVVAEADIAEGLEAAGALQSNLVVLRPTDIAGGPGEPIRSPGLAPEHVALLQHSSGTTGLKKGVTLSNRSIIHQLRSYASAIRLDPDRDRIASWLPLYHDMGLIACFLLPMATGTSVVMMSPFDWVANPVMLLQAIARHRCTLCWQPNFAYKFLAERTREEDLEGLDLSSMRAFINCAEPVTQSSHDAFMSRFRRFGAKRKALAASYAMAENTFAVSQGGIAEPLVVEHLDKVTLRSQGRAIPARSDTVAVQTVVSSGTLLANHEVRIVDAQRKALANRHIGEIAIRSDCMLTEYYRRPDATAAAVVAGWYYTGDLGYMAEGHLFVTGRKKDMIIVAGKNIYPQDIEDIAFAIPGILSGRAVAFGLFNSETGTEDVVLLAETNAEGPGRRAQLKLKIAGSVRDELECVVNEIHLVPHMWLLKSTSGKISRGANRDRYLKKLAGRRT